MKARPAEVGARLGDRKTVSLRRLKQVVLAQLPDDHPLRAVLLAERDVLTTEEFLAKLPIWLILLHTQRT